ncbi:MAG TPA: anaerobic ribonucleoside-triphosphate reductase activating protein [Candidatus Nanoarchaeia archaeon]|nr:anaerobic ribonucleoside-triphosphate reductase activating protein [Candidatus Nanoarchaeia archaeon]
MKIGGLEKLSLIDYPGELSAVVFTIGCTFRCPFCYNPMLVLSVDRNGNSSLPLGQESEKGHTLINEDDLFLFLKNRSNKLDAVVITGGEPTLQPDLPEFIRRLRALGYKIKLDTNGTNPEMLKELLADKLIDYLAMDIKAAPADYSRATGTKFDFEKIRQSVKIIMQSLPAGRQAAVPYEFRTTCVPGFIAEDKIAKMGELIRGADKWYLQNFKSDTDLIDKSLKGKPGFSSQEIKKFADIGRKYVKKCEVRG